jgi:tetratricopeptide (TPR) repeat protein
VTTTFLPYLLRYGKCLLFVVFIVAHQTTFAISIDSLEDKLRNSSKDIDRILLLKSLGETYLTERNILAISCFEKLIPIAQSIHDAQLLSYAYNKIGACWYYAGNLQKSSESYYKALEFSTDDVSCYADKARIYNNLGWNYKVFGDAEHALSMYSKAIHYARFIQDSTLIGPILNNKGVTEKDLHMYDRALESLIESLEINRSMNNAQQVRFNLNNLSVLLIAKQDYKVAIDTLTKVLTFNIKAQDTTEIVNNYINFGRAYLALQRYDIAYEHLAKALDILPNKNIDQRKQLYCEIDHVLTAKGDHQHAALFLRKYLQLSDSIHDLKFLEYTRDLDARYNSMKKDRDLENVTKQMAEQRFYTMMIVAALLFSIITGLLLILVVRMKVRNEKILRKLHQDIKAKALALEHMNEEFKVSNENLEKIVSERTQVIREQNERLLEFVYLNSHKIRGPIATLLGLVHLMQNEKNSHLHDELVQYVCSSAKELDCMVRDVNRELEKETFILEHEQSV